MAIHELTTNASRHGALSRQQGHVKISWRVKRDNSPALTVTWREMEGPAESPPARTGFGVTILDRTAEQALEAKVQLNYEAEGLTCTMPAPLVRLELSSME